MIKYQGPICQQATTKYCWVQGMSKWLCPYKNLDISNHLLPNLGSGVEIRASQRNIWLQLITHVLTHWGRVTHICVSKLTAIGSENGLSPGRHQAIMTKARELLIRSLKTNLSEILNSFILIQGNVSKMLSAKWRRFYLGPTVLTKPGWSYNKLLPLSLSVLSSQKVL